MFVLFKDQNDYYLTDSSLIKNNCWYIHENMVTGEWVLLQSDNEYHYSNNPNYIDPRIFIHEHLNWSVIASTEQLGCAKMLSQNQLDEQLLNNKNKRWLVESYQTTQDGYCEIKIIN